MCGSKTAFQDLFFYCIKIKVFLNCSWIQTLTVGTPSNGILDLCMFACYNF